MEDLFENDGQEEAAPEDLFDYPDLQELDQQEG